MNENETVLKALQEDFPEHIFHFHGGVWIGRRRGTMNIEHFATLEDSIIKVYSVERAYDIRI